MTTGPEPFGPHQAVNELRNIADWRLKHTPDELNGGFIGEIDYHGHPVLNANKGIILNSRILWFFSECCLLEHNPDYQSAAGRAFQYLIEYFDDKQHGGTVWELAADGSLVNGKKQVYAFFLCRLVAD